MQIHKTKVYTSIVSLDHNSRNLEVYTYNILSNLYPIQSRKMRKLHVVTIVHNAEVYGIIQSLVAKPAVLFQLRKVMH